MFKSKIRDFIWNIIIIKIQIISIIILIIAINFTWFYADFLYERVNPLSADASIQYLIDRGYVPNGYSVRYDRLERSDHVIQVFEDMGTHVATYNWYNINMFTGEIIPMFKNQLHENYTLKFKPINESNYLRRKHF